MFNIARFSAVLIALIALAELLVRLTITSPTSSVSDNEIGWVYKPHSTIFQTKEGWASNTTNSLGFNDDELINNETTQNILILGDSITEALQVTRAKNFTSLIEQERPCINSINAGRSGLSPLQYPVLINRFLNKISISKAVMVLTSGDLNDIKTNKAKIVRDHNNHRITEIVLKEKKLHWLREKTAVFFNHSALTTYFKDRVKALLANKKRPSRKTAPESKKPLDNNEEVSEILTYVFNLINSKIPLSIIYIPELKYFPTGRATQTNRSALFSKLIESTASENKIPFLSAEKYMEESYRYNNRPPVGFANYKILAGHLNETGHQSVAATIVKLINTHCELSERKILNGADL